MWYRSEVKVGGWSSSVCASVHPYYVVLGPVKWSSGGMWVGGDELMIELHSD